MSIEVQPFAPSKFILDKTIFGNVMEDAGMEAHEIEQDTAEAHEIEQDTAEALRLPSVRRPTAISVKHWTTPRGRRAWCAASSRRRGSR